MKVDLVNWFEIITAIVVVVCCAIRPSRNSLVLAHILFITLAVEFTAKYLNERFRLSSDVDYRSGKYMMYSLFNIVKFCGFSWFLFFLVRDYQQWKNYLTTSIIIVAFVLGNLLFGQGFTSYNNYSNVVGIVCLALIGLRLLYKFEGLDVIGRNRHAVLLYLCVIIGYYSLSLPTFLFFQQMYSRNPTETVVAYRLIIDTANYFFYTGLSLATILFTFANRPNPALQPIMI